MSLTGKTRVRVTRWRQKLILQVETVYQPRFGMVRIYEDGTSEECDPDPVYSWRDATVDDIQAIRLELPDLQNEAKA